MIITEQRLQEFRSLLGVKEVYTVDLPSSAHISKKVIKALNLNVYRNLHYQSLNKQKTNFEEKVIPLLSHVPKVDLVWLHYEVFAPTERRLDLMNVGSIVDKFFSDTLVAAKKVPDDNYNHIVFVTFSFGGVSKLNGHVKATINVLEKEIQPVRILLDQDDIQKALDTYLNTLGIQGATGVELGVEHGEVIAEVMMGDVGDAKPKNKGGRPKGSKNKPKETKDATTDTDSDSHSENDSDRNDSGSSAEASSQHSGGTKGSGKGNFFDDSEEEEHNQSSENNEQSETEETQTEEVESVTSRKTKKSSIFDDSDD